MQKADLKIQARRIDPKQLPGELYYLETCKGCDFRKNNLSYSRSVQIMNQEIEIKTDYHEACASCYAKFLAELNEKGEVFYIV